MRKLQAFAAEQDKNIPGGAKVDDLLFLAWLRQQGVMEPTLRRELESLPNNGGIYKILLKGGQDEKGHHHNPGL